MPRTKEQFQAIRDEKINLIMDTALRLFAKHGFHNVSTAMLTKEIGISKGLLYHYFENKSDLVRAISEYAFKEAFAYIEEGGKLETGDDFEAFVRATIKSTKAKRELYQLLYAIYSNSEVKEIVGEVMNSANYMEVLYGYFQLNFDDPEREFTVYMTMHEGTLFMYGSGSEFYGEKQVDYMIEEIIKRFKK